MHLLCDARSQSSWIKQPLLIRKPIHSPWRSMVRSLSFTVAALTSESCYSHSWKAPLQPSLGSLKSTSHSAYGRDGKAVTFQMIQPLGHFFLPLFLVSQIPADFSSSGKRQKNKKGVEVWLALWLSERHQTPYPQLVCTYQLSKGNVCCVCHVNYPSTIPPWFW